MNREVFSSIRVMFELFLLGIPAALVVTVVLTYRGVVRRDEHAWTMHEVVMVDVPGVYRASQRRPGVVERFRRTPKDLKVTALFALIFGVMWLPSLPVVAVGALVELDGSNGRPGLATLFGLPGIALSIAHFVLGLGFTRRGAKSRKLARGVALWSVLHNVVLIGFVFHVTFFAADDHVRQIAKLDALGSVAVLYALLSMGFAWFAWRAAKVHETLDLLDSQSPAPQAPSVLTASLAPADVPIASYGEAPPYP